MSKSTSAVVMPTTDGVPKPDEAATATKMAGGGLVLSPLPLAGGKRRKSRRVSKKVMAMVKKMGAAKLAKLMKGGEEAEEAMAAAPAAAEPTEGARRRRKTRKASKKSRKGMY